MAFLVPSAFAAPAACVSNLFPNSHTCSLRRERLTFFTGSRVFSRSSQIGGSFESKDLVTFCAQNGGSSEQPTSSRREVIQSLVAAALGSAVWTSQSSSAFAFDPEFVTTGKNYQADTEGILSLLRETVDSPNADNVAATRKAMNDYASMYRRNARVSGLKSYDTIKTLINSLAGHYNNYGPNRPLPKKLKARVEVLFQTIEKALARETAGTA
eukprot:CAMPEP_0184651064 /NCGR_PEP_ID=MMETSP0308-20130426/8629_1 /TAXON_ID=38269 /ORGANISM="Gloeochaete witrockiana, Strain SAG 46.84" /LENGTH=212 /DNA_ID=CAMNT_0027085013 /DNA_START=51 /DNA_END=689 /DNA_ORIENTATION=-